MGEKFISNVENINNNEDILPLIEDEPTQLHKDSNRSNFYKSWSEHTWQRNLTKGFLVIGGTIAFFSMWFLLGPIWASAIPPFFISKGANMIEEDITEVKGFKVGPKRKFMERLLLVGGAIALVSLSILFDPLISLAIAPFFISKSLDMMDDDKKLSKRVTYRFLKNNKFRSFTKAALLIGGIASFIALGVLASPMLALAISPWFVSKSVDMIDNDFTSNPKFKVGPKRKLLSRSILVGGIAALIGMTLFLGPIVALAVAPWFIERGVNMIDKDRKLKESHSHDEAISDDSQAGHHSSLHHEIHGHTLLDNAKIISTPVMHEPHTHVDSEWSHHNSDLTTRPRSNAISHHNHISHEEDVDSNSENNDETSHISDHIHKKISLYDDNHNYNNHNDKHSSFSIPTSHSHSGPEPD